jgi:hypothetical protein
LTDQPPPQQTATGPAICANHHDRVAAGVCDNCGTFSCHDCLGWLGSRRICITCVNEGRVTVYGIPWEKRKTRGILRAWGATVWETVSRPVDFYRRLDPKGSVGEAFLFSLLSFFWLLLIYILLFAAIGALILVVVLVEGEPVDAAVVAVVIGVFMFYAAMIPTVMFVMLMVASLIHHLMLMLMGGGKEGLAATMRVTLYTSGIVMMQGIPCLNYVAWIWYTVLFGLGHHHVHRDEPWKSAIAVITPLLLCCMCIIGYYVFIFAMVGM